MPATFVKDVLKPGTYHTPAGKVTFTPDEIKQIHANAGAMKSNGFNVPLWWDHSKDALPAKASDRASRQSKYYIDDAQEFRLVNGGVQVKATVSDDADAKQIQKVKFASPGLKRDYVDGAGNKYPGWSIVHVAVTPVPVATDQNPFQQLSREAVAAGITCLSLADLETVNLSEESETGTEGEGTGESGSETETEAPETSTFDKAIEALEKIGLVFSDDVNAENAWDHIVTAVETKLATEGETIDDEVAEPPEDASVPEGTGNGMNMVGMSLESLTERCVKHERTGLQRRIDRLLKTRRIPAPIHKKLTDRTKTVELSLTADGVETNGVIGQIEAFEMLPEGNAFGGTGTPRSQGGKAAPNDANLSRAIALDLPDGERGPPQTPEEVESAVTALAGPSRK